MDGGRLPPLWALWWASLNSLGTLGQGLVPFLTTTEVCQDKSLAVRCELLCRALLGSQVLGKREVSLSHPGEVSTAVSENFCSSSIPLGSSGTAISAGRQGTLSSCLADRLLPGDGQESSIQRQPPWHFRPLSAVTCVSPSSILTAAQSPAPAHGHGLASLGVITLWCGWPQAPGGLEWAGGSRTWGMDFPFQWCLCLLQLELRLCLNCLHGTGFVFLARQSPRIWHALAASSIPAGQRAVTYPSLLAGIWFP